MANRVVCVWGSRSVNEPANGSEPAKLAKLTKLAEACYRLSPQIAIRAGEAVFLEIGKCQSLYSEASCVLRLRALCKRLEITGARVAVADDLPAALAAAVYGTEKLTELPLEALSYFLMPLRFDPVLAKKCGEMSFALTKMGLRSIADFLSLNPRSIIARFGVEGDLARRRVIDRAQFLWPPYKPTEPISEQTSLVEHGGCLDLETILFPLRAMIDRACSRLWGRSLRATQVRILFELDTHSQVREPKREFIMGFSVPQGSARTMIPAIREKLSLALARAPLESPAMLVRFDILQWVPASSGQKHFFNNADEQNEMLGSFADRLKERLGSKAVFGVRLCERYLPEKAWAMTSMPKAPMAADEPLPQAPASVCELAPRPNRILAEPLRLSVGQVRSLKILSGPERIASEWWTDADCAEAPQDIVRDYYRVLTPQGEQWWVYCVRSVREIPKGADEAKSAAPIVYLHGAFTS